MFRRREPVPFAFVAEADRFRSNVTPPPRARALRRSAGGPWSGLTVVAGLWVPCCSACPRCRGSHVRRTSSRRLPSAADRCCREAATLAPGW